MSARNVTSHISAKATPDMAPDAAAGEQHVGATGRLVAVLSFTAALAASAQVAFEIGVGPVPVTLQTLVLCVGAALLAPLSAAVGVALYLAIGAAGLPVFADGAAGVGVLLGPTGGFLVAFLLVAPLASWSTAQSRRGPGAERHRLLRLLLWFLFTHALVLALGGWRLGLEIGREAAVQRGVLPFLPGGVLKSLAAAIVVDVVWRVRAARRRGR